MTLTAPKHLRGRIGNWRRELLEERAEWIRKAHGEGHTSRAIGEALGISHGAAMKAVNLAGCRRINRQSRSCSYSQGLILGPASTAYDSLPIPARAALADAAARKGKPMLQVMADFWAQHHGAQA